MATKTSPLGKGLMALLPSEEEFLPPRRPGADQESPYFLCPIEQIQPNPCQPRKIFDPFELESLTNSVREKGILQPLVVRRIGPDKLELIAGERRLRAAHLAKLEQVPVIVKEIDSSDRLELALIENIQREALNPLEESQAYARLIEEFGLTQDTVAKRVGKKRSTVANSLRILQLPDYAKASLNDCRISAGHARVLLSVTDREQARELHDAMVSQELSVRAAEELAKKLKSRAGRKPRLKPDPGLPPSYCQTVTRSLSDYFGAKSTLIQNGGKGKLQIEYRSPTELERILALIIQER